MLNGIITNKNFSVFRKCFQFGITKSAVNEKTQFLYKEGVRLVICNYKKFDTVAGTKKKYFFKLKIKLKRAKYRGLLIGR